MSWTAAEAKDIFDHTMRAFLAAIDLDADTVAGAVEYVGQTYGHKGVYSMCVAMASAVEQMVFPPGEATVDRGSAAVTMLNGLAPEDQDPALKPHLFAVRFLTATLNGDPATRVALFFAPIRAGDSDAAVSNVYAVIKMAADLARQRMAGAT